MDKNNWLSKHFQQNKKFKKLEQEIKEMAAPTLTSWFGITTPALPVFMEPTGHPMINDVSDNP